MCSLKKMNNLAFLSKFCCEQCLLVTLTVWLVVEALEYVARCPQRLTTYYEQRFQGFWLCPFVWHYTRVHAVSIYVQSLPTL